MAPYTPIPIHYEGNAYSISLPQWQWGTADLSALGSKARLMTAEEVADNPKVIKYLVESKSGLIKQIN